MEARMDSGQHTHSTPLKEIDEYSTNTSMRTENVIWDELSNCISCTDDNHPSESPSEPSTCPRFPMTHSPTMPAANLLLASTVSPNDASKYSDVDSYSVPQINPTKGTLTTPIDEDLQTTPLLRMEASYMHPEGTLAVLVNTDPLPDRTEIASDSLNSSQIPAKLLCSPPFDVHALDAGDLERSLHMQTLSQDAVHMTPMNSGEDDSTFNCLPPSSSPPSSSPPQVFSSSPLPSQSSQASSKSSDIDELNEELGASVKDEDKVDGRQGTDPANVLSYPQLSSSHVVENPSTMEAALFISVSQHHEERDELRDGGTDSRHLNEASSPDLANWCQAVERPDNVPFPNQDLETSNNLTKTKNLVEGENALLQQQIHLEQDTADEELGMQNDACNDSSYEMKREGNVLMTSSVCHELSASSTDAQAPPPGLLPPNPDEELKAAERTTHSNDPLVKNQNPHEDPESLPRLPYPPRNDSSYPQSETDTSDAPFFEESHRSLLQRTKTGNAQSPSPDVAYPKLSSPPNPKRPTQASQKRQHRKLMKPFRSPLIVKPPLADELADPLPLPPKNPKQPSVQHTKTSEDESATKPAGSMLSPIMKHRTARAASQFKSPLSSEASAQVLPSVRMTPTIQNLERKVQILRRAVKIQEDNGEGTLESLASKWREAAREVAWEVWSLLKDRAHDNSANSWGYNDQTNEKGTKRPFDEHNGWDDQGEAKVPRLGELESDTRYGESWEGGHQEGETTSKDPAEDEDAAQETLGTMLRRLGIAPETLGWKEEEGTFVDD